MTVQASGKGFPLSNEFNIAVCASGGGGNFQSLLDSQNEVGYRISVLIADRPCHAVERAKKHSIPCKILNAKARSPQFFEQMGASIPLGTDLIVLAGFMPIISAEFCNLWAGKLINTHPSLLPKYGGKGMYGVKVQEAVMAAREEMAGCTVHYVNDVIDGGEIILQKSLVVDYSETPWELGGRIFKEENRLLVDAVRLLMNRSIENSER